MIYWKIGLPSEGLFLFRIISHFYQNFELTLEILNRFNISKSAFYLYKNFIMKRTIGLIAILCAISLILPGCNKSNTPAENPSEETSNQNLDIADYKIDYELPEWVKTSLTSEELDEIAQHNFPKSYTYTSFNKDSDEAIDNGAYIYPDDTSYTLLIPEHATMASREVIDSSIQDGMIYTDTKVTLQDDTEIKILYIVSPDTLDFIAASVEKEDITTNYQFSY